MNNSRFNNVKPIWNSVISWIIANVNLSGNEASKVTGSFILDFTVLKAFKVGIHHPKAPRILEIIWHPPILDWIKCNTDGSALGSPGPSACGGLFRDNNGNHLGSFADFLGDSIAFLAELSGIMRAIELAFDRGWHSLWIECDSKLATMAFNNYHMVPCHIRNRWDNCLDKTLSMNFLITHVYREGNHCTIKLANLGLSLQNFVWWNELPRVIRKDFARDRLGLPCFRFC
jgi:ribonuclease HI